MVKRLLFVFITAFILNFIWEELHSYLYVVYKGAPITHWVLVHAALFDAFVTGIAALLFFYIKPFRGRLWAIVLFLTIFAIGLEIFALQTSRWQYNSLMPIIPVLQIGLTPTLQLGALAYVAIYFISKGDSKVLR